MATQAPAARSNFKVKGRKPRKDQGEPTPKAGNPSVAEARRKKLQSGKESTERHSRTPCHPPTSLTTGTIQLALCFCFPKHRLSSSASLLLVSSDTETTPVRPLPVRFSCGRVCHRCNNAVCVCVCERERESKRESHCVCVYARVSECVLSNEELHYGNVFVLSAKADLLT